MAKRKSPKRKAKATSAGKKRTRYIFVVGGVMSGVGKGVATASIGAVLQSKGFVVTLMKADPYLNVDAGTMNPTEHGEVFVLDSGLETDQDMGNYERFLGKSLPPENYMTNGMIFKYVIDKERALGYGGKCVEPTYHITEEILRRIQGVRSKTKSDFVIVEIGGTVGEYQNAIFIEAGRQLKLTYPKDVMFVMVSYLPTPSKLGEMKTKPTQNAVRQLNSYGVNPDIIIARNEAGVDRKRKEKIANMCGVEIDNVISAPDVKSIYEVPINFEHDGISKRILQYFDLVPPVQDLKEWRKVLRTIDQSKDEVRIAICGKYFDTGSFILSDAYISVIEALKISAYHIKRKPVLNWINVKDFENGKRSFGELADYDGILIPGGFGETGVEAKIAVIRYAREHGIPYFGLCYGMQLMVIEYARNVLRLKDANTHEINPNAKHKIIDIMEEQRVKLSNQEYGGTMRLGSYPCILKKGTLAEEAYGARRIVERHRHRYEVNPEYIPRLTEAGLIFSGTSPDGKLMEIAELPESVHPFFLGTQFHPEFGAQFLKPHPLFTAFVKAAGSRKKK